MSTALAERPAVTGTDIERVLVGGDLAKLTADQRVAYYLDICKSLGLNPHTKPFAYITLNGKLVLYALKDATEQLRKLHSVSITELSSQRLEDVFVVTAKAQDRTHRTDAATGAVAIGNLKGESLANALMKAETKAKRRVTLSICGLGMLDETEVETIPDARHPVITEAPKRVELPDGAVQILKCEAKTARNVSWADVTFVDGLGVETTLPTDPDAKEAAVSLFEQLAQEACPVWLVIAQKPRSKKWVIAQVHRTPPSAVIDAEIAAKEAAAVL